jgi:hypothetical protein
MRRTARVYGLTRLCRSAEPFSYRGTLCAYGRSSHALFVSTARFSLVRTVRSLSRVHVLLAYIIGLVHHTSPAGLYGSIHKWSLPVGVPLGEVVFRHRAFMTTDTSVEVSYEDVACLLLIVGNVVSKSCPRVCDELFSSTCGVGIRCRCQVVCLVLALPRTQTVACGPTGPLTPRYLIC